MKISVKFILCLCFLSFIFFNQVLGQKVYSIKIDGAINPVTADFIKSSIEQAADNKAECLIIHLNTPGGLLKSTRVIVSDMLESPVPIVVYVSPGGSHAGSAGVFITMAANIAAMAPSTNIGAAHPVSSQGQMDSVMSGKVTNDASAFIKTIAEKRNRNVEWAEDAVRNSVAITETEALDKKVIDLIASNEQELLEKINGMQAEVLGKQITLQTKNAKVERLEMGWVDNFLAIISDPNIAYILMMVGMYGIMFELYNPSSIFPGVVGVISLILAFYAMHTLPINYAGLGLIIFAIILFLLEIKIISHGILAIGGVISLFLGSIMLFRNGSMPELYKVSWGVIISSTILTSLFFLTIIGMGMKAQLAKPMSGADGIVGELGEAINDLDMIGRVRVQGESWNAESISGRIEQGDKVEVTAIENLKLFVKRV